MPITLSDTQLANLEAGSTRPVYVVNISFSGAVENLSCSGAVVLGGVSYEEGAASVHSVTPNKSASLTIPATPERMQQLQSGAWRNGLCTICHVPGTTDDEDGVVYDSSLGINLLEGEISRASYSNGKIRIEAVDSNNASKLSPPYTWDELTVHCPAPGTIITWEGENLVLASQDIGPIEQYQTNPAITGGSRMAASRLKELIDRNGSISLPSTAAGAAISIIYGQVPVSGKIFAVGDISGDLVLGVGWGYGEISSFEDVYINDAAIPGGVTATHYVGTTTQTVDSTLSSAITAFNDNMVLSTPNGDIGACYSVFRIPSGQLSAAPNFKAVINGRKVYDPRTDTTVYSDTTALCAADFISNPIFGGGKTVLGLDDAADYNEEIIGGSTERCRLAHVISTPRRWAEHADLLCEYAECVWFAEGASVRIRADKIIGATNPSGREHILEGQFGESGANWEAGDGWVITEGVATVATAGGVGTAIVQTVDVNPAVYSVEIAMTRTAGELGVVVAGQNVIQENATGTYQGLVTLTGTTARVEVFRDVDFVGTVTSVSMKRLYWLETKYIANTLSMSAERDSNSPTAVKARYSVPDASSPNWTEGVTSTVRLPGVDTGDLMNIETTLHLPGVYREAEALNKANMKLARSVNKVSYQWETVDYGVRFQRGDVVQLKLDQDGIDDLVWIDSVTMVEYGNHRVSGTRYSETHYPSELPSSATGSIPVGAIIMLSGSTVPSGWSAYSLADGKYIIGAGGTYSAGDTGGTATHAGFSATTTESSGHDGGGSTPWISVRYPLVDGGLGTEFTVGDDGSAVHSHTVETGEIDPELYTRENRLIQKVTSTTQVFPAEGMTFGLPGIATQNRSRITAYAGRLLKAAAASANAGQAIRSINFTSSEVDYGHAHWASQFVGKSPDLALRTEIWTPTIGGGVHSHTYSLNLTRNIKKRSVALYGGLDDYPLAPGDMVLWEGSLESLPADWYLCNGQNATPDLRDYFLEIATVGGEDQYVDVANGIALSGSGNLVGHTHGLTSSYAGQTTKQIPHGGTSYHTHSIDESDTWTPPYYALAMIMYAP